MRVIAGRLRGRSLHSVRGEKTRPTTGRARAALFDWLGPDVADTRVLDLFAGTGAIGIEALSRGARHATFVERDRRACAVLRRNLADLELESLCRVLALEFRRAVARLVREGARFELVVADPPYGEGWVARLLAPDGAARLVAPEGCLVIEHDPREEIQEFTTPLVLRSSKTYGETRFDRFEPSPAEGDPA
jgi:16S rRNA (guanine966-N2)-methyltransferase